MRTGITPKRLPVWIAVVAVHRLSITVRVRGCVTSERVQGQWIKIILREGRGQFD